MNLNPNVNVDVESSMYADRFYPDEGYALWQDDEYDNLDENGNPYQYYLQKNVRKTISETVAPHIWAKLIDETMEVYGKTDPNQPEVATYGMRRTDEETSHTYIDENGVERMKKGVY